MKLKLKRNNNSSGVIVHSGVLGMKWGVRRSRPTVSATPKQKKIDMSDDAKKIQEIRKKRVSELSNQELTMLRDRMALESVYSKANKSRMEKGTKVLVSLGAFMGAAVTAYNNAEAIAKIANKIASKRS